MKPSSGHFTSHSSKMKSSDSDWQKPEAWSKPSAGIDAKDPK